MPSKSQNYIEIAYKMLEKKNFEMKNFKFLKIVLDVDRWCGIWFGSVPWVSEYFSRDI